MGDVCDDLVATPPDPWLHEQDQYLRRDGAVAMQGPLRAVDGAENRPALASRTNPRDGWWFPGVGLLAASLNGVKRFLLEHGALTWWKGRWAGRLEHQNTADRTWTMPDAGGQVVVVELAGIAEGDTLVWDAGEGRFVLARPVTEVPSGDVNGTNQAFTLQSLPVAGSVWLHKNGVRLRSGAGNDYTIAGQTITMVTAPRDDGDPDVLLVDYVTKVGG